MAINSCIAGYLPDLEVGKDIDNLSELFGPGKLNYDVYPKGDGLFMTHWKEQEFFNMLQERARALNEEIEREGFDGLVVAISGHGMNNKICTSDYQLVDKVAIHRIFSAQYPELRDIPRLFIFDCCDGSDERLAYREEESMEKEAGKDVVTTMAEEMGAGKNVEMGEAGKNFVLDDVERPLEIWVAGERNPDYKLMEMHAANSGFQAKRYWDPASKASQPPQSSIQITITITSSERLLRVRRVDVEHM